MGTPSAIEYFSVRASVFMTTDGNQAQRVGQHYRDMLDTLKITIPRGKLLDVGIASASLSLAFKTGDLEIFGIDGSEDMLALAEKNGIPESHLTQLDLLENPIPFDDDSFDIVVTSSTLFYLKNACQVIEEMIAVTKPGGIIMIDPEIHDANTNDIFPYQQRSNTPLFFVQSESALTAIFAEKDIDILYRADYAHTQHQTKEEGRFTVTNSVFILRKK
jgi:ubiquinone/menaquinone biosynthesis C-methylase UbiE